MGLLPAKATSDVRRVVVARTLRGFADGFVSVLLGFYLPHLGFSKTQVGAIVTGTLLGSAALTLAFGLRARRFSLRTLLLAAAFMMVITGVGFTTLTWFWPLFAVAVVGTLNPSGGDVSVFLPTEQALVASEIAQSDRPQLYAFYNVAGTIAGAVGAALSAVPDTVASHVSASRVHVEQLSISLYLVVAVAIFVVYLGLGRSAATSPAGLRRPAALRTSRRTVFELAGLFSLDSAGSGFVWTPLVVIWLRDRFGMSARETAALFSTVALFAGCSQFLAPRIAKRVGLIRTMAFTHIPANGLLALAAFAPNGGVAVALLLGRALFQQMDVPARQSFVMALVPAEERAAASSITNVPRSLASALTPLAAGVLLQHSNFGWPLLIAGTTKLTYDILLLTLYRNVPEQEGASRRTDPGSVPATNGD